MTIAAKQFGMSDPARSLAAAENILTAQSDLAGIFAPAAVALGAIAAIWSPRVYAGKIELSSFAIPATSTSPHCAMEPST